MVEFGLKLQDNKVADWSDRYIDYERLKRILEELRSALKKRDDLMKRQPDLAFEIQQKSDSSLVMLSDSSLQEYGEKMMSPGESASNTPETQSLVSGTNSPAATHHKHSKWYGSDLTSADDSSGINQPSVKGALGGYFSRSRHKNQIIESVKHVSTLHTKFEDQLFQELDKVNKFYESKVHELDNRLSVLVDSVRTSQNVQPTMRKSAINRVEKNSIATFLAGQMRSIVSQPEGNNTSNLQAAVQDEDEEQLKNEDDAQDESTLRVTDSIQRALVDQYRTIKLLHNFSILNYTGFVKIVKKHDKTMPQHKGKYKDCVSDTSVCNESREVTQLEERMEHIYAEWFCDGNLREARAQLLPKRGDGLQMDWSQLRLGYRLGMCAVLSLWVCWDCIWGLVHDRNSTIGGRNAFPVFRACGGLLLLHWFWGCSVYVWTRYRINYIFLFDLNPKTVDSPVVIFNDAVDETLVFLVIMLVYYKAGAHDIPNWIPAGYFPFFLLLYTLYCLVFPFRKTVPMWKAVFQVVTSPFSSPTFFTIYIADVFTSMVKVFQDIAWSVGFVLSKDFLKSEDDEESHLHFWQHSFWYKNVLIPLICLWPLWIRFNQCLRKYLDTGKRMPNLANAFKYAMSQTVTLFGAFHPLYLMQANGNQNLFQVFWMMLFVSSSLYSFWWDVCMDWGLGYFRFGLLGPRLMYPNRSYYYIVMALDIVLRFMWVLTLLPPQSGAKFEIPQYLSAVTMTLELARRTIWGFFRLENEHRSNTNQYRRVSFVPLHFNTGHQHEYNRQREHVGWSVLAEVAAVTVVVVAISITSVIAAQKATEATNHLDL